MGCCKSTSSSSFLFLLLLLLLVFDVQIVLPVHGKSTKRVRAPKRKLDGKMTLPVHGESNKRLYIVYMGHRKHDDPNLVTASHHETLASVLGSKEEAVGSIVYSYRHGFSGFSAMITDSQARQIANLPGVVHVAPSVEYKAQTTRSWDFLGLDWNDSFHETLLQKSNQGEDVIIGVVDSGIWPESKSFNDTGYGPIPTGWKGKCEGGNDFNGSTNTEHCPPKNVNPQYCSCNKKIIGARFYKGGIEEKILKEDYLSPRDMNGHGTHTASIAAGSPVKDVSFSGLAPGLARGGAPRARIAVYKVIWGKNTEATGNDAGILKAIDHAIKDKVHVLSLSIGAGAFSDEKSLDFALSHAVENGITVVFAAGNSNPDVPQNVAGGSPWVITVAASTIDRAYPTSITLPDKRTFLSQPIYYTTQVKGLNDFNEIVSRDTCEDRFFKENDVKGKLVLCRANDRPKHELSTALINVEKGGAKGLIFSLFKDNVLDMPDGLCAKITCKESLPFVFIDSEAYEKINDYIKTSSRTPKVKISSPTTVAGTVSSPKVASFSSRGPNAARPSVLKPDIAAPGVSILAARRDSYALDSGTSMATPHISGIVALLKNVHRDWTPAAIKSALVTTANTTNADGGRIEAEGGSKPADPFDFGGGNVNPNKAMDPGLVYDIDPKDYHRFDDCVVANKGGCNKKEQERNLNLPSIAIPDLKTDAVVRRTVTNVGEVDSTYNLSIEPPTGIEMNVKPETLVFSATKKTLSFTINFSSTTKTQGEYEFGSLTWKNSKHSVRIPIAVQRSLADA